MAHVAPRPLEWVHPPKQERSHQTLERLLRAAEELIIEHGYEGTTVAQIARAAGSSVGAFYARFGDKESLLRCLMQKFSEEAIATASVVLDPRRWADSSLREFFIQSFGFLVAMHRQRARLISAFIVLRDEETKATMTRLADTIAEQFLTFMKSRPEPVSHPDPGMAIRFVSSLILDALRSRSILLAAGLESDYRDDEMARELVAIVVAYARIEDSCQEDAQCR